MSATPLRRASSLGAALLLLSLLASCSQQASRSAAPDAAPAYHPEVEPYATGYLDVGDGHELFWELSGNPDGMPAIVLHGGPGGSARPALRRYFDPERFQLLLFDQRGAGRSRPTARWQDNTTQHLVEDIERLRAHLEIEGPALVFGGSWGSTLALAYAEAYPEKVAGLVLRGVFLGTRAEIDHFYHGGAALLFPDAWEDLRAALPDPESLDYPRQLFELTQSEDPEVREQAIRAWARYEIRMVSVGMTDEQTEEILDRLDLTAFSVLENHYMMNGCFLEEGQLLRDLGRIAHIPTFIAHGRFDIICAPQRAWQLAQGFETVELRLIQGAGHSGREPAISAALLEGVGWVADRAEGTVTAP